MDGPQVEPGSPAAAAGLVAERDFVLASETLHFQDVEDVTEVTASSLLMNMNITVKQPGQPAQPAVPASPFATAHLQAVDQPR